MKCLFVGPKSPDYLASCIYDGLQEVLGEQNVVDASDCPWLHKASAERLCHDLPGVWHLGNRETLRSLGATREGLRLPPFVEYHDLMVVISSFNRERDWAWVRKMCEDWVSPNAKIAYVEGWDSATHEVYPPQMPVDAVFRKEIDPNFHYPYACHHLTFAAPARWFLPNAETCPRPVDISFSGNPDTCRAGEEVRWPMLSKVFQTRKTHRSAVTTCGLGFDLYFDLLRKSKLALCPSGADLADSMRTMEAVACGAIPVFVGYPNHVREPWFGGEHCISCTADTLAEHLDEALAHDQTEKRRALLAHAKQHHTTAARARQMLKHLGIEP